MYAGIAGLDLQGKTHDFGEGVVLRPTFAHLFGTFMVAFSPAEPGKAHPVPWKAAHSGFAADVTAELYVPQSTMKLAQVDRGDLIQVVAAMLRFWVTPTVLIPILSNVPIEKAKEMKSDEAFLLAHESRGFDVPIDRTGKISHGDLDWVLDYWKVAFKLTQDDMPFRAALFTLDRFQFVRERPLALISFWAALEGLFLKDAAELRFRLAAYLASYLEEPGENRIERFKAVLKLYDHRSKAAHGQPKNDPQALGESYMLLRDVIVKIIEANHVPTKTELERRLFAFPLPAGDT